LNNILLPTKNMYVKLEKCTTRPFINIIYLIVAYLSDGWKTRMQQSKVRKLIVNVLCKDVFSRGSGYNVMSTKTKKFN
jgi:hypothetical protein